MNDNPDRFDDINYLRHPEFNDDSMTEVEDELVSNCCGESVYLNTDICVECGEHCEPTYYREYFEGEDWNEQDEE